MKRRSALMLAGGVAAALLTPAAASASRLGGLAPRAARGAPAALGGADRRTLIRHAAATWRSMEAMLDPTTGLVADNIEGSLDGASRDKKTSPTNIGCHLWSAITARELGLISPGDARRQSRAVLDSLASLQRHPYSGMFFNWYDPRTGEVLTSSPTGDPIYPFLSSVDNAWLAAALMVVGNDDPALRPRAQQLLADMDFGFYYDPNARGADFGAGLLRGGFWPEEPPGGGVKGNYPGRGPDVWYTGHHYGAVNSETRIISYVGIALGQVPAEHYFALWRTFEPNCDWAWQEMKPVGDYRDYLGIRVFEGAYRYRGLQFVPSWGGDMFEVLMPDLFVPEARWAPNSWGRNHPVHVRGQIEHGLDEAKYGHWGFSPASDPFAEYREWGVDPMGLDSEGYTSDRERTRVDYGFEGCAGRDPKPEPAEYGDGVVTPHAVFLALPYAPAAAMTQLGKLRSDFDSYGPGGFYDAIAVRSGTVARRHLALDQGMIMAALGNLLANDVIRRRFTHGQVERELRDLLRIEEFNVPAS